MRALQNALTLTAVLVVAVSPPAWSQSPVARIAFIDVQRVLVRSAAGVAARDQLEREKAGMQQKMDAKRKELEMLRDELEKKGPLMTAEARRDKQDAFERNRRDAARLADDLQKELEKKEQQLLRRARGGPDRRDHPGVRSAERGQGQKVGGRWPWEPGSPFVSSPAPSTPRWRATRQPS